jgi:hypothetical protein
MTVAPRETRLQDGQDSPKASEDALGDFPSFADYKRTKFAFKRAFPSLRCAHAACVSWRP